MMYAGIDFSMSCPAITVGDSDEFEKCATFFLTKTQRLAKKFSHNIYGCLQPDYSSQEERFANISKWALAILKRYDVKEVCIEGHSMRSKGAVFDIGENTGVLKHNMFLNGIIIHVAAPKSIKKFFTSNGNADKFKMYDSFISKNDCHIVDILESKADKNPVSDIVDSYAILQYGRKHHFKQ